MLSALAWTRATVQAVHDLSPTIRRFDLAPAEPLPFAAPGSHVDVTVQVGGRPQTRSYSVVEQRDGVTRIAVRRADDGRGGSRYLWSLAPGAQLTVSEPKNHFALRLGAPQYLLLAGGIGVTPLVGVARGLAAAGADVAMAYAVRRREDLVFQAELREALGRRLATHVSADGDRLDVAARIAALAPDAECYVCGPLGLLDAVRRAWADAGRPAPLLRYETFGNSGRHAPEAFTVSVPRHGLVIDVPADVSLLDALTQAGVDVLSDCRRGECGLCALDVVDVRGRIDHRDVFLSEAQRCGNRTILPCVSRVAGGGITLDSSFRDDAFCVRPQAAAQ